MERSKNNLFKFATKELSQDAFLAWSINCINYEEHYPLGRDILKMITKKFLPDLVYEGISVDIKMQYKKIDILLIINKEYFIIIEDKILSHEHDNQMAKYKKELIQMLDEDNDKLTEKEKEKIRENKNNLDIIEFNKNNVYAVYFKTGKIEEKDEKVEADSRITNEDILKVLAKYKSINIVEEFYENISENEELFYDKSDKFVGKTLNIGEKFGKKYYCFNCFSDQLKFKEGKTKYDKEYQYKQTATKKIPGTKCDIWTPKTYTKEGWINILSEDKKQIKEYKIENGEHKKQDINKKSKYVYVFLRKRDEFKKEYFEFSGIFYLDKKASDEKSTVWIRYEKDNVSLNAKNMEKEIDNFLKSEK